MWGVVIGIVMAILTTLVFLALLPAFAAFGRYWHEDLEGSPNPTRRRAFAFFSSRVKSEWREFWQALRVIVVLLAFLYVVRPLYCLRDLISGKQSDRRYKM